MRSKDRYGLQWDDREELLPHLSQWADHNDKKWADHNDKKLDYISLSFIDCLYNIFY